MYSESFHGRRKPLVGQAPSFFSLSYSFVQNLSANCILFKTILEKQQHCKWCAISLISATSAVRFLVNRYFLDFLLSQHFINATLFLRRTLLLFLHYSTENFSNCFVLQTLSTVFKIIQLQFIIFVTYDYR